MSKTSKNINIDNLTQPEGKNSQPNSLRGGELKIMKRFTKKAINVMTTAALLASLATPVLAASENRVSSTPTLTDDAKTTDLGVLSLKEDDDYPSDFKSGGSFTVTFPSGVKVKNAENNIVYLNGNPLPDTNVDIVGDYTINVTLPTGLSDTTPADRIEIKPNVTIDGFSGGPIEVTVEDFGAGITGGKYILGYVAGGETTTTVLNTVTMGEETKTLGTIRITESAAGSIGDDSQSITLKLPKGFKWKTGTKASFLGGFTIGEVNATIEDDRTAKITFNPNDSRSQRGIIQITPVVEATSDASYGDITVEISGDEVEDASVVIGKYADYGVTLKVDGDVKEIISGRLPRLNTDDNLELNDIDLPEVKETSYIQIKESIAGSIIENRKTKFEFPAGVKVLGVKVKDAGTGLTNTDVKNAFDADIDGKDNVVEVTVPKATGTNKTDFKVAFLLSVRADFSGDIVAKISGRQGIEGEVVVAKAVAPVTATANSKDVKVGLKGQSIGDIIISEGQKEALKDDQNVIVELEDGDWTEEPTVEVIEGNVEIDKDSIDVDNNILSFKIKAESTKPSKIKISGGKIDLYRSVPEGPIYAKIKGGAIIENDKGDILGAGEFDQSYVAKVQVANVVTPAPGEAATTAKFTIGSNTYTVNGEEKVLDVAPYIENGRTFLPVRFVAEAVGVTDDNILVSYDPKSGKVVSVTLIKGDRIAKITIGSKVLTVNGVDLTMDVAAQIKNGRTVLPLRHVATALGANINWDDATDTVTVERDRKSVV